MDQEEESVPPREVLGDPDESSAPVGEESSGGFLMGSSREEEEEEAVDLAPNVPKLGEEQVNRRATLADRLVVGLGVAGVTKDPDYKAALTELEEFEKGIKTFKTAVALYLDKFKASIDAESTVRVLATTAFGPAIGSKIEAWSEARSVAEATKTSEVLNKVSSLRARVEKYEKELRLTKEATNKATLKARRDFDHYESKVSSLTQQVLNAENDLAKRAARDKQARDTAAAQNRPPPEKTTYFWEDSNEVAASKLEKLKDKLKRNEDKLEIARIWNERTHTYGKLSFKTLVEGCEADCVECVKLLIALDQLLSETAAKSLPTYQAVFSALDSDGPPLNERLAAAKQQAGYNDNDVAPSDSLDHDDDDDATTTAQLSGLCGFGH